MRVDRKDAWQALLTHGHHAEANSWSRFYNCLMFSSILTLAWATIYSQTARPPFAKFVLSAMATIGLISAVAWAFVGWRSREWATWYYDQAKQLEDHHEFEDEFRIVTRILLARDQDQEAPGFKIPSFRRVGSFAHLVFGPAAMAILFLVLLIVGLVE